MRAPTAMTIVAVVASSLQPLAGQNRGMLEIGGFGRFMRFDRSLQLDNVFGLGGYVGLFATPAFALEVAGSYIPTTGPAGPDTVVIPLYARLVLGAPIGEDVALLLGGGYLVTFYGTNGRFSDHGVNGLIGVRFGLSRTLGFRLGASADFVPSPAIQGSATSSYWNFALEAGVSAWLGRSRPPDRDRDGVADQVDACGNTLPGAVVDPRGCALPGDGDNDGVTDAVDRCPQTQPGEKTDAQGCSLPREADADLDGVVDSHDDCPDTPRGARVNAAGCPGLFADTQRVRVLEGVTFDAGSTTLSTAARRVLDQVAVSLQAEPGLRVEVAGHTNESSWSANIRLSWSRAEAVRRYLIERGVPAEQVTARGFGGSQSRIDLNVTAEGRARNRRIELRRLN